MLLVCCLSVETLTLTARFTWLSWVAGAAAEGRLEVVDGLLKDLPFSALMKANSYKPVPMLSYIISLWFSLRVFPRGAMHARLHLSIL